MYNVLVELDNGGKQTVRASLEASLANVVLRDIACLSSVYVGAIVRMNASGQAENAVADILDNCNVMGIVEEKPSLNSCHIRVIGRTLPDTVTGLDVTKSYYLSSSISGAIQDTVPPAPSVKVPIGKPISSNELMFMLGQRIVRQ